MGLVVVEERYEIGVGVLQGANRGGERDLYRLIFSPFFFFISFIYFFRFPYFS